MLLQVHLFIPLLPIGGFAWWSQLCNPGSRVCYHLILSTLVFFIYHRVRSDEWDHLAFALLPLTYFIQHDTFQLPPNCWELEDLILSYSCMVFHSACVIPVNMPQLLDLSICHWPRILAIAVSAVMNYGWIHSFSKDVFVYTPPNLTSCGFHI